MKKNMLSAFVLAPLMLGLTAQAAYQSQTLLRYAGSGAENGLIQTLPAVTAQEFNIYTPGFREPFKVKGAALLYDKRNPLPSLMMVGGNYAFFKGGIMATVSEDGSLYYKGKTSVQAGAMGGNYFLNLGTNEVITIDSAGFYNSTGKIANNVRLLGGNFYIDQSGTMTTIKHMGSEPGNPLGMLTVKEGWNFNDVVRAGGNFMMKVDGSIVGVNSENGFFTEPHKLDSNVKQIGGNYFITEDKTLYTVTHQGEVKKQMPIIGEMKYYGYSYMIDGDGDFIYVDGQGVPHTEMVRVSTTGVKSEVLKQITGTMDTHQNFIPAQQ
jgi:hypothetical protein